MPGYTILGEIGRGATGIVYRARHETLDRVVALKVLCARAGGVGRLLAEAQSVARLHHANIVQVFEVGDRGGPPYLALEYVAGGTLMARTDGKPKPIRASVRLVGILARAVQAAHARGLVHRDLKPANILLATTDLQHEGHDQEASYFGTPKIADFGLALRLDYHGRQGDDPELVGTPHYMAPELARGRVHEVGPSVDVYALGTILYELVSGRRPFQAESLDALLDAIVNDAPPPLGSADRPAPRDLEAICRKAMAKHPWERYRSASALADDLDRFLRGESVQVRPPGAFESAWRWSIRNPGLASLVGTAAVLLGVGLPAVHWLNREMVRISATQCAEQQAQTILEVWDMYAKSIDEAGRVAGALGDQSREKVAGRGEGTRQSKGIPVADTDFKLDFVTDQDGMLSGNSKQLMPAPATFLKLLGAKLRETVRPMRQDYEQVGAPSALDVRGDRWRCGDVPVRRPIATGRRGAFESRPRVSRGLAGPVTERMAGSDFVFWFK